MLTTMSKYQLFCKEENNTKFKKCDYHHLSNNFLIFLVPSARFTKHKNCALIESQNSTCLAKHLCDAYDRKADVRMYQETCVLADKIGLFKAMFASKKWDAHLTQPSPETSKPSAGVATMSKQPGKAESQPQQAPSG